MKGEIEHYYTQSNIDYLNISNKDNCFHIEREYLLQVENKNDIITRYSELIGQLKQAVPTIELEYGKHLKFKIIEWIHKVQTGIASNQVNNKHDLINNSRIKYALYNQILDLEDLIINKDRTFKCSFKLKSIFDSAQTLIEFTQETNAHDFKI